MNKIKLIITLGLTLVVLFAQTGNVAAAPVQDTASITGIITNIALDTDANGVTTVLVTLDDLGTVQTVRISLDTAFELGLLVTLDPPVVDESKINSDTSVEIDPDLVITEEEESVHPLAALLAGFFGADASVIDGYHTDGFGFGVIAQALWMSQNLNDDASLAGQILEATVYMPPDRGKNIRPGMEVRVEPTTIKREEYGAIVGRVLTVSDFPVTPQGMLADLHNDALVKRFSQDGAPYAAKVMLERDPSTASGYRWTSGKGPPILLSSGTLTRAEVTTREQPPIDLVIPLMKRLSGIGG